MKTIIALVDFSDVAANVLKQVQVIAQAFKSQVTVLHGMPVRTGAIDVPLAAPAVPHQPTEAELKADMAALQKLTEPLRACGLGVTLRQFHGTTIDRIAEEALQAEADLIVVGSHQHNSFYNLLVGSVTNQILSRAKCPVLVVSAE